MSNIMTCAYCVPIALDQWHLLAMTVTRMMIEWHMNRCSLHHKARCAPSATMIISKHYGFRNLELFRHWAVCPTSITWRAGASSRSTWSIVYIGRHFHWFIFFCEFFFLSSFVCKVSTALSLPLCGTFSIVLDHRMVQFDRFIFKSLLCTLWADISVCDAQTIVQSSIIIWFAAWQPAGRPTRRYCLIQIENHTRCFHFMFSVLVHCGCLLLLSASMAKDNLITVRSLRTVVQNWRIFLFSRSHHLVRYNWIDREAAQRMSIQCGQSDPVGPQPTDSRTHNF